MKNGGENHYGKDNLEGQREPPCDLLFANPCKTYSGISALALSRRRRIKLTVVNPVAERDAGRNQHTFDHDHLATVMGFRRLGLPGGYSTRVHAVADTCDNSCNDEVRQLKRGALQNSASSHGYAANEDGSTTSKRVTNEDGQDGSNEASQVVSGDCNALVRGALRSQSVRIREILDGRVIFVDSREVPVKRRQVQQTTSDTLIITEEPFARQSASRSQAETRAQAHTRNRDCQEN